MGQYHIFITDNAKEDIETHRKSGSKQILLKILTLLEELTEHPFTGTGKPEPLKYQLTGMWSRRINREHRLIYEVMEDNVYILSAKGHYEQSR